MGWVYLAQNWEHQRLLVNTLMELGCILIFIQQDATLHSLFYLETALHVSGGTITLHQEGKRLYLQHLVFVTPLLLPAVVIATCRHYCYLPLSWKSWIRFDCPVGDVRSRWRWRNWLRHRATSRKVSGSIHNNVIGIFH